MLRTFDRLGVPTNDREVRQIAAEIQTARSREGVLQRVNIARKPRAEEITTWTTRKQTGFVYHSDLLVRIKGTDVTFRKPFSTKYDRTVSYRKAMYDAIANFEAGAAELDEEGNPKYGEEEVVGAVVLSVMELQPFEGG